MLDPRFALRALATGAALFSFVTAALAFSQIAPSEGGEAVTREGIIAVPLPPLEGTDESDAEASTDEAAPVDPAATDGAAAGTGAPPTAGSAETPVDPAPPAGPPAGVPASEAEGTAAPVAAEPPGAVEPVRYGEDGLPNPVRDLRRKLIEIARAGDIDALKPYLQTGEEPTVVSFGDAPADPISFLKEASGDGEGAEILAILLEILQAGHAHVDAGEDSEIYVWPYFAQADLDKLTRPQKVELFEIVTAGDFEAMKGFGAYNFYRAGISPEGRLEFFVAGD